MIIAHAIRAKSLSSIKSSLGMLNLLIHQDDDTPARMRELANESMKRRKSHAGKSKRNCGNNADGGKS
jgi:hypothetical protein